MCRVCVYLSNLYFFFYNLCVLMASSSEQFETPSVSWFLWIIPSDAESVQTTNSCMGISISDISLLYTHSVCNVTHFVITSPIYTIVTANPYPIPMMVQLIFVINVVLRPHLFSVNFIEHQRFDLKVDIISDSEWFIWNTNWPFVKYLRKKYFCSISTM